MPGHTGKMTREAKESAMSVVTRRVSPDKEEARRIWRAMQEAAIETGLTQPEWKWQTFADFWQFYVEDQSK
jgi:hypothetical protein